MNKNDDSWFYSFIRLLSLLHTFIEKIVTQITTPLSDLDRHIVDSVRALVNYSSDKPIHACFDYIQQFNTHGNFHLFFEFFHFLCNNSKVIERLFEWQMQITHNCGNLECQGNRVESRRYFLYRIFFHLKKTQKSIIPLQKLFPQESNVSGELSYCDSCKQLSYFKEIRKAAPTILLCEIVRSNFVENKKHPSSATTSMFPNPFPIDDLLTRPEKKQKISDNGTIRNTNIPSGNNSRRKNHQAITWNETTNRFPGLVEEYQCVGSIHTKSGEFYVKLLTESGWVNVNDSREKIQIVERPGVNDNTVMICLFLRKKLIKQELESLGIPFSI